MVGNHARHLRIRSAARDPHDRPTEGDEVAAVAAVDVAHRRLVRLVRGGEGGVEGLDPLPQPLRFGLEVEDLADAGQAHAVVGELLDALQQRDVAVGVPRLRPSVRLGSIRPLRS